MEHRDIPDGQVHEPKGAGSAVASSVIKSNGDGTTSFSLISLADITDISRMPLQADAVDETDIVPKFNQLLSKLKAAGYMETS